MNAKSLILSGLCAATALFAFDAVAVADSEHSASIPGTLEGIRARLIEQHQAVHDAIALNQVSEAHTHLALIRSLSEASLGKVAPADRQYVYTTVANLVILTDQLEKTMVAANPGAIQAAHGRLEAALQTLEAQLAQARPLMQQQIPNRTTYRPRYYAPHRSYARPYIVRPRVVHPPTAPRPPVHVVPVQHKSSPPKRH